MSKRDRPQWMKDLQDLGIWAPQTEAEGLKMLNYVRNGNGQGPKSMWERAKELRKSQAKKFRESGQKAKRRQTGSNQHRPKQGPQPISQQTPAEDQLAERVAQRQNLYTRPAYRP
jgi:hypothetical protein